MDEVLHEQFHHYLFITEGWSYPSEDWLCDRCGGPNTHRVRMSEPFEVRLILCGPCMALVKEEARLKYSGYLGLAGVYAHGYLAGYSARPVKAPQGAPQAPEP